MQSRDWIRESGGVGVGLWVGLTLEADPLLASAVSLSLNSESMLA